MDESSALIIGGRNAKMISMESLGMTGMPISKAVTLIYLAFFVQCHPFVHNIIRAVDIINFCSFLNESKWQLDASAS